ncbi:flocculation protein FLO11-like [Ananas comosus]|uniref:Flocculation protein FLO11-like n=1 Tax=Ananas comosus TaxID=4615 RepID=A0A6P5F5A0_ANACO|nr:flocculation protein FLO11-like [Ananas comosus]
MQFSSKSEAARTVPRPSSPTSKSSKSSTPSSSSSSKSTTPKARLPNSQPPPPPPPAAAVAKTTLKQELNLPLKSSSTTPKKPTIPKIRPNSNSNMNPRSSYRVVAAAAPKTKGSDNAAPAPVLISTTNVAPTTKAHFAPSAVRGRRIDVRPDNSTNKSASTPSTAAQKECVGVEKVRSGRREREVERRRSKEQGVELKGRRV